MDSWLILPALIVMTGVPGSCFIQSSWQNDENEADVIFNDSVLFKAEVDSIIDCADSCNLHTVKCRSFSYTSNTKECRGYGDLLQGRESQAGTSLWKKVCRRDDYTYDPAYDTCVRLFSIEKSWWEASYWCNNDGAYLLIVDTVAKMQATQSGLHSITFQTEDRWWLGGYDYDASSVNDFRWINGEPINDTSILWHPNEPNDVNERCINLYSLSASLNDLHCSTLEYFVCQEDLYT
ncbi:C-type lectin domain family 6 member A-like [Ylistrum balloti]|uniref:C-type lectin domain family 6 member A-like n=1 Tax=Ylistrum balloti TaxID=509963 RepID=UPI002905D009|nr:C-type lectin domain family 6 member A-like [Ylistrum balloti]